MIPFIQSEKTRNNDPKVNQNIWLPRSWRLTGEGPKRPLRADGNVLCHETGVGYINVPVFKNCAAKTCVLSMCIKSYLQNTVSDHINKRRMNGGVGETGKAVCW